MVSLSPNTLVHRASQLLGRERCLQGGPVSGVEQPPANHFFYFSDIRHIEDGEPGIVFGTSCASLVGADVGYNHVVNKAEITFARLPAPARLKASSPHEARHSTRWLRLLRMRAASSPTPSFIPTQTLDPPPPTSAREERGGATSTAASTLGSKRRPPCVFSTPHAAACSPSRRPLAGKSGWCPARSPWS